MEGEDPHRRQYDHPNYPQSFTPSMRNPSVASGSGSNIYDGHTFIGAPRVNASERFRQAQALNQPTPTSIAMPVSGGQPQSISGYGYAAGSQYTGAHMQGNPLHYQPDYIQDSQRQQQYPGYTSQMLHQQVQPPSPYDNMPQYPSRQTAAIEGLPSQFGDSQYYNSGEPTSASIPAPMAQHHGSANYQPQLPYQSGSIDRSALSPTYASSMTGFPPAGLPVAEEQPTQSWEREFEEGLREINLIISNGTVGKAGPTLLDFSQWFLGKVSEFGTSLRCSTLCRSDMM